MEELEGWGEVGTGNLQVFLAQDIEFHTQMNVSVQG